MALAEVTPLRTQQVRDCLASWAGGSHPGSQSKNALRALLPDHALRQGSTVTVSGSTSLALATVATAKQVGSWCAAVNFSDLGVLAAVEAGLDLEKFALVPRAGGKWPVVVAALIDAFDVVLLSVKQETPGFADARRLSARARERNTILIPVVDDQRSWPYADLRLGCDAITWEGIGNGHGHLTSPQLHVSVGGRGAATQVKKGHITMVAS